MSHTEFLCLGNHRVVARLESYGWSLAVEKNGSVVWRMPAPAQAERGTSTPSSPLGVPYSTLQRDPSGAGWIAKAELRCQGAALAFEDFWQIAANTLRLHRTVTAHGNLEGGFLTLVKWSRSLEEPWPDLSLFVPGMLYGSFAEVADQALGSRCWRNKGVRFCRIREDRMPAPLLVVDPREGNPLAILNPAPDGRSTREDFEDTSQLATLTQPELRFGSLTAETDGRRLEVGYLYPGDEGEVTYTGDTFPGGQLHQWRRRFHPWTEGMRQSYQVDFRFDFPEGISRFPEPAWRWAWDTLKPRVKKTDLREIRLASLRILAENAHPFGTHVAIPLSLDAATGQLVERKALFGFTGRNTDAAWHLLEGASEANLPQPDRARFREVGTAILDSFSSLRMDPPEAEGFDEAGRPFIWPYLGRSGILYLRSLAEAGNSALQAWTVEKQAGREHPQWRTWAEDLARFLLRTQRKDGSFPRGFFSGSAREANDSPQSTLCAVRFLVECAIRLGMKNCQAAAVAAADFAWSHGHDRGRFVGGTIDNPDVVDKEAGTIALDAYLALHECTGEPRFLEYARAAATFAETWIYLWNVPMPATPPTHYQTDIGTVGMQLIATGHSLVDAYMAFDAGNYLRLHRLTGDNHFREVAEILLHNTKAMMATRAQPHDLAGPGWQQEHWSFAPPRGCGLHRYWLPWVSVSHLHGMASWAKEKTLR